MPCVQFYLLQGTKAFVTAGSHADVMVVLARTSVEATKGLSAFLVMKVTRGGVNAGLERGG